MKTSTRQNYGLTFSLAISIITLLVSLANIDIIFANTSTPTPTPTSTPKYYYIEAGQEPCFGCEPDHPYNLFFHKHQDDYPHTDCVPFFPVYRSAFSLLYVWMTHPEGGTINGIYYPDHAQAKAFITESKAKGFNMFRIFLNIPWGAS